MRTDAVANARLTQQPRDAFRHAAGHAAGHAAIGKARGGRRLERRDEAAAWIELRQERKTEGEGGEKGRER